MDVNLDVLDEFPVRTSTFELVKQVLVNQQYMLQMLCILSINQPEAINKEIKELLHLQLNSMKQWQKKQQATEMLNNLEDDK